VFEREYLLISGFLGTHFKYTLSISYLLKKIKTGIKSGGKIILKSAKPIQSAKPTSSQQTDGNSSERSTESEDDFDYFGGIFEGLRSGTTNRRTSSNLSHRTR
jgi:hypothetical protein